MMAKLKEMFDKIYVFWRVLDCLEIATQDFYLYTRISHQIIL